MWAFCSKKSWQWDQNKEAQERNGKITEGMACNVQRKVQSDRIGRLVMIRNGDAINLHKS